MTNKNAKVMLAKIPCFTVRCADASQKPLEYVRPLSIDHHTHLGLTLLEQSLYEL